MRVAILVVAVILVACGGSSAASPDDYVAEARAVFADIETQAVADLVTDAATEPALVLNEDWKAEMIDALETWEDGHDAMQEIDPTADAEDTHDAALDATECLSDAADRMIPMVEGETLNFTAVSPLIQSCTSLIRTATRELDALEDAE